MTWDAIIEWGRKIFEFTIVTINRTPVTVASGGDVKIGPGLRRYGVSNYTPLRRAG
jgi:hypothetical protein